MANEPKRPPPPPRTAASRRTSVSVSPSLQAHCFSSARASPWRASKSEKSSIASSRCPMRSGGLAEAAGLHVAWKEETINDADERERDKGRRPDCCAVPARAYATMAAGFRKRTCRQLCPQ